MVMMSVAEQHSTVRGSLAGAAAVCTEHTTSTTIAKHTTWYHYCLAHYLAALLPSHYLMVLLHTVQCTVHTEYDICLEGAAATN